MRRKLTGTAISFSIYAIVFFMAGCMALLSVPRPYDYVLEMGDTGTITQWTLRQTSHGALMDGEAALIFRLAQAKDAVAAESAFDGYLQVAKMVQDLPSDFEFPVSAGQASVTRDGEVAFLFERAAFAVINCPKNQYFQELFRRLRPTDAHPGWLQMWQRERHEIEIAFPKQNPHDRIPQL